MLLMYNNLAFIYISLHTEIRSLFIKKTENRALKME